MNQDRLYELIPYVYKLQDTEQGYPLRDLLRVIAEQVNLVEADITQLYENWFVETAQEWIIPYIGDVVNYQPAYEAGEPNAATTLPARQRILIPRADIANTVRYRRRRGTLAVLEELARDVAGWSARAVEFYQLLSVTQSINHLRTTRGRTADVRCGEKMSHTNDPFDTLAHTADVRRINSSLTKGRHNIPSVGLFVWRLKPYLVKETSASRRDDSANCFTFSILGNDTQLYLRPQPESHATNIAEEWNLPVPIRRLALEHWQSEGRLDEIYGEEEGKSFAIWAVYKRPTPDDFHHTERELVQPDKLLVADLSKWSYEPKQPLGEDHPEVMVDPELGRIAFPSRGELPDALVEVQVSYHYAFSDDIGGAMYQRPIVDPALPVYFNNHDIRDAKKLASELPRLKNRVNNLSEGLLKDEPKDDQIDLMLKILNLLVDSREPIYDDALAKSDGKLILQRDTYHLYLDILAGETQDEHDIRRFNRLFLEEIFPDALYKAFIRYEVRADKGTKNDLPPIRKALKQWEEDSPRIAVIELCDSAVYEEALRFTVGAHQSLYLRAANGQRPIIALGDTSRKRLDALEIVGEHKSHITLDGLLIAGRMVQVRGKAGEEHAISEINIRHCTFVPGWVPAENDEPTCHPQYPDEYSLELRDTSARVTIDHSILGSINIIQDEVQTDPIAIHISDSIVDATDRMMSAIDRRDERAAHAALHIVRTTVIGQVRVHALDLAENSIFDGIVWVMRRQRGCMRFCWYDAPGSRVPRRFNCQPDLAEDALRLSLKPVYSDQNEYNAVLVDALAQERSRLQPRFNSRNYGSAAYCQLAETCAAEITAGADDESEMGVFHDLYQPQRTSNLRARLEAFVPAGVDAGIIFAS
jgi:hypothetical protein